MLGNLKCKTLSCIDLKDAIHSLRIMEDQKSFVEFCPILVVHILDMKFGLWTFQFCHADGWSISEFY